MHLSIEHISQGSVDKKRNSTGFHDNPTTNIQSNTRLTTQ